MNVLYIESAKTTWLFELRLLNPHGFSIRPLFEGVVERYKFAKFPSNPLDVKDGGIHFVEGIFRTASGLDVGVSLSAYNDGLVADSFSNTDHTTEFLRDLARYAGSLGYPFPDETSIGKGFTSILGVSCEGSLSDWMASLDTIARFIEKTLVTMDGKPRSFVFSGISLHSEDIGQNKAPVAFKFERKWGVPFNENRYITTAPLETSCHIALLDELEHVLKP